MPLLLQGFLALVVSVFRSLYFLMFSAVLMGTFLSDGTGVSIISRLFFSFYLPVLSSLFSGMRLSVRVCIVGWSILSKVNSFLVISVFCRSFILSCIIPKPYVTTGTIKVFYASILLADFDSFFGIVLTLL